MRSLIIIACVALSGCADDTLAFERCAARHQGEPRVGQCQYTLHQPADTVVWWSYSYRGR
jgi:hypothetical protein